MENRVDEVIKLRKSVRSFQEKSISDEIVTALLNAAIEAPSASNNQLWKFGVVRDSQRIKKIKMFSPGMGGNPPCLIVLCTDKKLAIEKSGKSGTEEALMDISMAGENIMLKACDLGLGTCAIRSYQPQAVHKLLKLPENLSVDLIISVGYADKENKKPARKPLDEVVFYEKWAEEQ